MMERANPLGEEKVSNLLVKYSVPATVGMLVNSLYNVVDRIFIGNGVGYNGLAGITIGFPIMIILMAISILFGIGGATLFSIRLGEEKEEEAELALGNALSLLVLAGIVFMVLGQVFLRPLLSFFGASEAVLPYSMEYMRVIFFGAVFQVVSMGMNNFIRADGNPKIAMMTMFIGAGLNILLDPLFIFVLDMGMMGAALATILAQGVSATWVVAYFLGRRSHNKLRPKYLKLDLRVASKITSLGIPGFALQLASSLLNVILNKGLIFYGGDIAVSGMGIIHSLMTILIMPIIGIKQGVQPIISFNFGARKFERVKAATSLAIITSTVIVVIGYFATRLFPVQMVSLFNREAVLVEFASDALIKWSLCLPVVGFQIIASNYFQAIGRSLSAMFLTLTRQVIFLIPAVIIFPKFWGIDGILYAAPFADFFSALLTGICFYIGIKNLEKDAAKLAFKKLLSESADVS